MGSWSRYGDWVQKPTLRFLPQIVAQPMDLGSVARRLEEGAYRTAIKVYRDVQLVRSRPSRGGRLHSDATSGTYPRYPRSIYIYNRC